MKSKVFGLLAAILLAGSLSAHASIITWNFNGQITNASGVPPDVTVGSPFQLALTFDTAAPLVGGAAAGSASGFQYRHSGASIGLSVLLAGPSCNPACQFGDTPPSASDGIFVFDDFSNTTPGAAFDGLVFSTFDGLERWNIVMTGATNLLSGSGIPSTPNPQFTFAINLCTVTSTTAPFTLPNGQIVQVPNNFGACSGQGTQLNARLVPTAVPEPESLALIGIGLAGLGLMRRRRLS